MYHQHLSSRVCPYYYDVSVRSCRAKIDIRSITVVLAPDDLCCPGLRRVTDPLVRFVASPYCITSTGLGLYCRRYIYRPGTGVLKHHDMNEKRLAPAPACWLRWHNVHFVPVRTSTGESNCPEGEVFSDSPFVSPFSDSIV